MIIVKTSIDIIDILDKKTFIDIFKKLLNVIGNNNNKYFFIHYNNNNNNKYKKITFAS